jgi:hypothetical protein
VIIGDLDHCPARALERRIRRKPTIPIFSMTLATVALNSEGSQAAPWITHSNLFPYSQPGKAISQISHHEIEGYLSTNVKKPFGTSLVRKKSEDPRIKVLSASKKATRFPGAS